MNRPNNYDWQTPQRQATGGLLIMLYKTIISVVKALWPLLAIMIFRAGNHDGADNRYTWWFTGLSIFILVRSVLEFLYFRFYIHNDDLIIRKGFITRKQITIPLEKIQAVHIEQNLLHQAMDIVKVRIDTAGSEKTEAEIHAIAARKADQLKKFLLQEKQQLTGEAETSTPLPEKPVLRLSTNDLFKLGLSANHIRAFFLALAFVLSVFQNLRDVFGDEVILAVEESQAARRLVSSIPLLIVFVLGISIVVSLVRVLLRYYNFYLAETRQGYKLSSGLVNTRQFLVPYQRIQYISWEANWLRRKIGLYTLEFHQVAGNQLKEKQLVRVPVTKPAYVETLLAHYHQALNATAHSVHHIHRLYTIRQSLLTGMAPAAVLLAFGLVMGWGYWATLVLLWVPYVFFNAWMFRKNFQLYISPDAFQVNSGIWGRRVRVVKWYKIQHVKLQQSLYQKRKGLATIRIATAGGAIKIPFIPLQLAQYLQNYALYEVERLPRRWL